jgi:elongation factor P
MSGQFHRMQMRKAVMRAVIRNLKTGQILQKTFSASDQFEPAEVNRVNVQYMYNDSNHYYFMDKETYEQLQANKETLGESVKYLNENLDVWLLMYDNRPIQLVLPQHVNLKVIESPMAIKGDSVTNTFKTVTCENGIKVSCPLFIKEGDILKVNTETGDYVERATA